MQLASFVAFLFKAFISTFDIHCKDYEVYVRDFYGKGELLGRKV